MKEMTEVSAFLRLPTSLAKGIKISSEHCWGMEKNRKKICKITSAQVSEFINGEKGEMAGTLGVAGKSVILSKCATCDRIILVFFSCDYTLQIKRILGQLKECMRSLSVSCCSRSCMLSAHKLDCECNKSWKCWIEAILRNGEVMYKVNKWGGKVVYIAHLWHAWADTRCVHLLGERSMALKEKKK